MSKSANNILELNKFDFDSTNNRINFSTAVYSNGSPIADETAGSYANSAFVKANSAFNSANNVAPQIQPAFDKANAAFAQANASLSNTNLNVSGTLKLLNQSGSEGGELFLDKPVSNTSLAGGVTIDIYQNQLRIFETGGGVRGAFIDIANTTANGVGSEITKYGSNTSTTSSLSLPSGTTAQRPASPQVGSIRYNTTLNRIEGYVPTLGWKEIIGDTYSVELLVVAGGGGGGNGDGSGYEAGGGGAGGLIYYGTEANATGPAITVTPGQAYSVTVGGGGSAAANGTSSSFGGYSTVGGGRGGTGSSPGSSGGSGGGGGQGSGVGGAGTPGQGYPGGGLTPSKGGSGGGAGGPGPSGAVGGGGLSLSFSISGTSLQYAGGATGGLSASSTVYAGAGTGGGNPATIANRGSGGGGAYNGGPSGSGGSGSAGVVVVRYQGSQRGSGGTVTSAGGYTIHTFTGSGTFTA